MQFALLKIVRNIIFIDYQFPNTNETKFQMLSDGMRFMYPKIILLRAKAIKCIQIKQLVFKSIFFIRSIDIRL